MTTCDILFATAGIFDLSQRVSEACDVMDSELRSVGSTGGRIRAQDYNIGAASFTATRSLRSWLRSPPLSDLKFFAIATTSSHDSAACVLFGILHFAAFEDHSKTASTYLQSAEPRIVLPAAQRLCSQLLI